MSDRCPLDKIPHLGKKELASVTSDDWVVSRFTALPVGAGRRL